MHPLGTFEAAERKTTDLIDNSDVETTSKEDVPLPVRSHYTKPLNELQPPPSTQLFQGILASFSKQIPFPISNH